MKSVCYLFIFIFEQFVSYLYFHNKFESKKPNKQIFLMYALSFLIQFTINIFAPSEMNLLSFLLCNIIVVFLCFNCSVKQMLFNVILLEGIMITSELAIMHLTSLVLNIDLNEYLNDNTIITLETIATKTFYFALAYIASKLSFKEKRRVNIRDISNLLFLLPLSSIAIIISFTYLSINYEINNLSKLIFTIISIILLFVNTIVFLVHENMVIILEKNTELQLEKQREEINKNYYDELQRQYDSSNILLHDIKKCLLNIRGLSSEKDYRKINEYIDSIYDGYEVKSLKQYSDNKLVNVIISRYAKLCNDANTTLIVDIRNVDFSFITDSDITALLDNLLENAFEAASISITKQIEVIIDKRNESYLLFDIINTCDKKPNELGHTFLSTKSDKTMHGFGLKSVSRIVKKYSGNLTCNYNDEEKVFHVNVLLKI